MAVKVEIFSRNLEVTDHINDYVTKKAGKLGRYLPELNDVRVDLAYIKSARSANDRMVAQITTGQDARGVFRPGGVQPPAVRGSPDARRTHVWSFTTTERESQPLNPDLTAVDSPV